MFVYSISISIPSKNYSRLNIFYLIVSKLSNICHNRDQLLNLVELSSADWLVPGLPAPVYNPLMLFFICELNKMVHAC